MSEAEYVAHMTSPNFPVQMAATVEGRSAIAKKIFSIGDSDGNGQATTAEATAVFQAMDADGNGELTRQEHHLAWAEVSSNNIFNLHNADFFVCKPWGLKGFFQFEIIINALVSSF